MFTEKVRLVKLVKDGISVECLENVWQYLTEEDCLQVMKLYIRHAVCAIAFDGICAFGVELKIRFRGLDMRRVQKNDTKTCKNGYVSNGFDTTGIQMVLIKGLPLSLDYPIPSHREWWILISI